MLMKACFIGAVTVEFWIENLPFAISSGFWQICWQAVCQATEVLTGLCFMQSTQLYGLHGILKQDRQGVLEVRRKNQDKDHSLHNANCMHLHVIF